MCCLQKVNKFWTRPKMCDLSKAIVRRCDQANNCLRSQTAHENLWLWILSVWEYEFDKYLRIRLIARGGQQVIRWLELLVSPPERGKLLEFQPVNHVHVVKFYLNPVEGNLENFLVFVHMGDWHTRREQKGFLCFICSLLFSIFEALPSGYCKIIFTW